MYKAGFGKVVVNYPLLEVGMMGYGLWGNRVKYKETNLHSRALVIDTNTDKIVFVNIEISSISPVLRRDVLKELKEKHSELNLSESNIMLTAQHTHSAPSGYFEYAYYTFTTPGFRKEILKAYVDAIVNSIAMSINNIEEVEIRYKKGVFNKDIEVAWNRSIKAYNENPENEQLGVSESSLALDRNMYLLQVENLKRELLGTVNWFGVHTTSIGNVNTKVSFDNKGYAAEFLEEYYPNTTHIFAQGKAGDVSPHFHGFNQNKIREKVRKQGDHLFAKQNGFKQFEKAKEIIKAKENTLVNGKVLCDITYADYTKINVDSEFSNGEENAATSQACIGLAFFKGTPVDGKGISNALANVLKVFNKIINKKRNNFKLSQGNKEIIVNASTREILGQNKLHVLPGFIDFSVKEMNKQSRLGALQENSLVPIVLPIQLFLLGNIAIVGIPGEITTIAGKRLEITIKKELINYGVKEIVLSPYANSYMGYITTKEEYDVQEYEGGHTIFGRWTLGAFQTQFKKLCSEVVKPKNKRNIDRTITPPSFSDEELRLRTY
jgi:neutral ceramidase